MPEFTSYAAGTPSWVDHATKDLDSFQLLLRDSLRLDSRRPR